MAILSNRPSRSYAAVGHDSDGLAPIGSSPYSARKVESGFKTYRPPLAESHLRSQLTHHDTHPNSAFSPLPPALEQFSRKHRKDVALAGQKAEIDHLLQPGYKSAPSIAEDHHHPPDSAGSSRRTAGGLGGKHTLKSSASMGSFKHPNGVGSAAMAGGGASSRKSATGGVYIDSSGKIHDTEYDPFAGVSEMSRRKTRRRSAFGQEKKRGSGSSSSESGSSGSDDGKDQVGELPARKSLDGSVMTGGGKSEDEDMIRVRLELERRRLDEVSGYAAARRRSIMSERNTAGTSGRGTPSLRSSEDARSRSAQGWHNGAATSTQPPGYVPSPLSPTFGGAPPSASSYYAASRTDESPQKSTENTSLPPGSAGGLYSARSGTGSRMGQHRTGKERERERSEKISVGPDKKITVTGFDAPTTPLPPSDPTVESLRVPPDSARSAGSSRGSSDGGRPKIKPMERPREELFPETPAQLKKREERQRARGAAGSRPGPGSSLAIDAQLSVGGRGRLLPEIEIVEDDDPRIVFSEHGKATRIQTVHDHVIRGPFSHALEAQGSPMTGMRRGSADGWAKPASTRSMGSGAGVGIKAPSSILDETGGGYLPSRWANGDRQLRVAEEEKEKYRPMEWGGKTGDLGGRSEEWRPTTKDQIKRQWKDVATNARFSLFRAKKKLGRKADL